MRAVNLGGPRVVSLAGLKWTERYNCYSVTVSPLLSMGFAYVTDQGKSFYAVKMNGNRVGEADSPKEAAALAVRKARELVKSTLLALHTK